MKPYKLAKYKKKDKGGHTVYIYIKTHTNIYRKCSTC